MIQFKTCCRGVLFVASALMVLALNDSARAQCVLLTTLGSPSTQNFDTLSNTAGSTTNNLTITGWFLTESGGGARDNEQYAVDTGGSNTGDTYSYGAAAAGERALGSVRSGTLASVFGACFTNNTGAALSSFKIDYTGEEWRLGTAARTDQLDFQFSVNATDLSTGAWTDVNELDFLTPDTVTTGAKNGNATASKTAKSATVTPATSIASGATFWIRWSDADGSGSDDGLAVDDFSLTPNGTVAATADISVDSFAFVPTSASAGGATTLKLVIKNNGTSDATAIVAKIPDDANLTFGTLPAGCTHETDATPNYIKCTVATLANGASTTSIDIPYTVSAAPTANTAVVGVTLTSGSTDPTPGNNTGSATLTINRADLSVTGVYVPSTVADGETTTLTLTVVNGGNANTVFNVTAYYDQTLLFVDDTDPSFPANCELDVNGDIYCLSDADAGETVTFAIKLVAFAKLLTETDQTDLIVEGDEYDPNINNNIATASVTVTGTGCTAAVDDNNVCTTDTCVNGVEGHAAVNTDDSNACTTDGCDPTTGVFHNTVNTDDLNACTSDGCDPSTGVFHTAIDPADTNACTTDGCDTISGVFHTPVDPNDNNVCTTDTCDPSTGTANTPVNTNDNNACTDDLCDPVTGITHPATNIDDGNSCTVDACDTTTGPSHTLGANVDDGNACTDDVCDANGVASHNPVNIDDNNACTDDACDTTTGVSHTPKSGISDGDACTQDLCDTATGTVTHPPLATINDSNACTDDACSAGDVTHTAVSIDDTNPCTTDACNTSTGAITHTAVVTDDSNACTDDACNTSTGAITHTARAAINDGNACTTDACNTTTGAITHTAVAIDDANPCTTDACNTTTGAITHVAVTPTSDNNACTDDVCNTSTGATDHTALAAINDSNACTDDACNTTTGAITHTALPAIDDANACTTDACDTSNGNITHTAVAVTDSNACTDDVCNTSTGAITHPALAAIDDGNACTTDACNTTNGSITHTAVAVTDNNLCTTDACDPATGNITNVAVSLDDSNACTTDACTAGGGITHTQVVVDDGNPCTVDACNAQTGISHTPLAAINDNDLCTTDACNPANGNITHVAVNTNDGDLCTADACTAGGGVTHTPTVVQDNNACTVDACNPTNGVVTHVAVVTDDNDACTTDSCNITTGVAHVAIDISDGNPCTTDACAPASGTITHVPVDVDDNQGCTIDACNPTTGAITHTPAVVDDNNACTLDKCDPTSGAVTHDAIDINDNNACTTDSCDGTTGVKHVALVIDDGNACTTDACSPTTGVSHTAVVINDNNACTTDSCDTTAGVSHTAVVIDDADACTTDKCVPATGVAHAAVDCDDNDPCTADSCLAATGCRHIPVACGEDPCSSLDDETPCDGGPCSEVAACDAGVCVVTTPVTCDDSDACTVDACDPDDGCVAVPMRNGDACDDGNACTDRETCSAGECLGSEKGCDSTNPCATDGTCNPATGVCDYVIDEVCAGCSVDAVAPVVTCPAAVDRVQCVAGGNTVTVGNASATDACSTTAISNDAPATFPLGTTIVTFTATDIAGNRGTCTTNVTVIDNVKPTITCPAAVSVTGDAGTCGKDVALDVVANDGCGDVTITGLEDTFFGPGVNTVTVTATDASGNAQTCETTVTVTELDDFTIDCELTLTKNAPDDFCGWNEALTASAVDQCNGETAVSSVAASFIIGETPITFSATRPSDSATASCTTTLTVVDATLPVIDCGGAVGKTDLVATFTPRATDNCGATIAIADAACARVVAGEKTAVSERCEVTIDNGKVVVADAPALAGGDVKVTYTVTATDPSGNKSTEECSVSVDPESLDHDGDTVIDRDDNCPTVKNTNQADKDEDGIGDACADGEGPVVASGGSGCAGGSQGALWLVGAFLGLWLVRRAVRREA